MTGQLEVTFSRRLRRRCPEVGFGEIAIDLLQARLWTVRVKRRRIPRYFRIADQTRVDHGEH
jgi:hypothetical protein